MTTITYRGQLVVQVCWCGMHHAVPSELVDYQKRQHDNGRDVTSIHCPLGHGHVPAGEGKAARLERELAYERNRRARLAADLDQTQASLRAQKGATTRARKRAAAALCPCCNRSFVQLRRHMAAKHPDYDQVGEPR